MSELALFPAYAAIAPCRHIGATKFAQSELDFVKQKAGHHHDDTLPLLVYCSAYSRRRTACKQKRTRTLFHKESGSYDLGRHSYGSRNRGLSNSNGLRLLIFPQPLGGALKNQNAAPTTPPCFCRRQQSSSLHWADCLLCRLASSEPPCSSPVPSCSDVRQRQTQQKSP